MTLSTLPPDFHILALSGGGYRGLYTATVLRALEQSFGTPISQKFDLICGTSVGGILALGLAAGIKTEELQDLFVEQGGQIFGYRRRRPSPVRLNFRVGRHAIAVGIHKSQ